jgi:hypothetical protein
MVGRHGGGIVVRIGNGVGSRFGIGSGCWMGGCEWIRQKCGGFGSVGLMEQVKNG